MKESEESIITWAGTNVCSLDAVLHDVIAPWKAISRRRPASANLIGRGKYLPTSDYSSAERPRSDGLLGKQRTEMGNKWAVCIWQQLRGAADGTSAPQSDDTYLWKKVTEVRDGRPAAICMWQLRPGRPLSSARRLDPQGQQPVGVTFN